MSLYISDSNQFWAFHPNGNVKWVVPISANFATAFFVGEFEEEDRENNDDDVDGYVGGITRNGEVLILHLDDGSLEVSIDLPGGAGPPAPPTPPGLCVMDLATCLPRGGAGRSTTSANPDHTRLCLLCEHADRCPP